MLSACIDRCPEHAWNAPVFNLKFSQVVFHTLFYADMYLGPDLKAFRGQAFHQENKAFFSDYEELEDRPPVKLYEKPPVKKYLEYCRSKAESVIDSETVETLNASSGFAHLPFPRMESHIHNIRHIYHHAAQLSLQLRANHDINTPWCKTGWSDL